MNMAFKAVRFGILQVSAVPKGGGAASKGRGGTSQREGALSGGPGSPTRCTHWPRGRKDTKLLRIPAMSSNSESESKSSAKEHSSLYWRAHPILTSRRHHQSVLGAMAESSMWNVLGCWSLRSDGLRYTTVTKHHLLEVVVQRVCCMVVKHLKNGDMTLRRHSHKLSEMKACDMRALGKTAYTISTLEGGELNGRDR